MNTLFATPDLTVAPLQAPEVPALQALFDANPLYFQTINGRNALPDEAELCAARSIHYIHIPVVWTAPTLGDLARFFDAMESNRDKAVLVHCALNYRASAFVFLWRVLRCDELQKIARPDMLAVWKPDETWQAFIDRALAGG